MALRTLSHKKNIFDAILARQPLTMSSTRVSTQSLQRLVTYVRKRRQIAIGPISCSRSRSRSRAEQTLHILWVWLNKISIVIVMRSKRTRQSATNSNHRSQVAPIKICNCDHAASTANYWECNSALQRWSNCTHLRIQMTMFQWPQVHWAVWR